MVRRGVISESIFHSGHVLRVLRRAVRAKIIPAIPFRSKELRRSNTLFVLGSGGSIAHIRQWEQVRIADSVGFNFWLLHDFVPDFYFVEAPREVADRDCLVRNLWRVRNRYQDVAFFNKIRDGSAVIDSALRQCGLKHRSVVPMALQASTPGELREGARSYRTSRLMRRLLFWYQGVATLELVVLFGWTLGYERIVLCGVDLNDTKYFFEHPAYHRLAERGFLPVKRQVGRVHKTDDPDQAWGGIAVSEVLLLLQEEVLGQQCRIYVESEASCLARSFPVHSLR
jgi:hypothetical protein